jgi:hypothetical protein
MDHIAQAVEAVAIAIAGFFSWRSAKRAKSVDVKTETNHGKSPGEYLEMVLDVKEAVLEVRDGQLELREKFDAHTEQDRVNFERIQALVEAQY